MRPEQVTPMMVALSLAAMAVLGLGAVAWAHAFLRVASRQPLVAWSPRRPVPWAAFDLFAVVALFIVASLASSLVLRQLGLLPPEFDAEDLTLGQRQLLAIFNIVTSLVILLVGLPVIALRTGAGPRDFGWSWPELAGDLKLGLIAFAMLAPPVYALQGLLVSVWKESKHPLMEMFKGTPDVGFFFVLGAAAVVVAPLFEELIFRVLLQGFLERLVTFRGEAHEILFGPSARSPAMTPLPSDTFVAAELPGPASASPVGFDAANPYAVSGNQALPEGGLAAHPEPGLQPELRGWQAALPIAVSSIIFALLHYSHGPDWIPLTLLAAGMGYLYQRTHRLLPSLIVHVLLNGFSMWAFWVQMFEMPQAILDFGF